MEAARMGDGSAPSPPAPGAGQIITLAQCGELTLLRTGR